MSCKLFDLCVDFQTLWPCNMSNSLTLYLWILGHQQKTPSERRGRGVGAGGKQVHDRYHEVFIMEVAVGVPRFLQNNTSNLNALF